MNISKFLISSVLLLFIQKLTCAAVVTRNIEYKDVNTVLEGYIAYDDAIKDKMPVVLIVHEWTGIGPYIKTRAEQIVALGYAAFAVDIYGKEIRPANTDKAAKQAAIYRGDIKLMRRRALAGLDEAKKLSFVDPGRVAAIGYCFGGGVVLEMARSGANLKGVVSFHGNLDTPDTGDAKNIKAKILVLHGADDPLISKESIDSFSREMRDAGVDWQMVFYGNSVHSFTNPGAGNDPSKGAAYNKTSDRRSWEAMKDFLQEAFMHKTDYSGTAASF